MHSLDLLLRCIIAYAGQGTISVSQEVVFSLITENPPVFTLTCITTGGPATTVVWRRERWFLSNGGSNTITKTLMDAQQSTYKHQLIVSARRFGVYIVSVTNSRTPSPVWSQYTVTGMHVVLIEWPKRILPSSLSRGKNFSAKMPQIV